MHIPGLRPKVEGVFRGEWEPMSVYLIGDVVTDTHVPEELRDREDWYYSTPKGTFRCLVDHQIGFIGPRNLEKDRPGMWERLESEGAAPK